MNCSSRQYALILILLIACADQKSEVVGIECSNAVNLVTLEAVDTLNINVPSLAFPRYDQLFLYEDILYCLKTRSYKFDLFDLWDQKFIRSIELDPNFVQNLGAFYVHNPDSIFITQELTYVVLLNDSGDVVDRFDLGDAPLSWIGSFDVPEYFFYSRSPASLCYNANRKSLIVTFTSPEIWYYKKRRNFQMHGSYNIAEKKWERTFGSLPEPYSTDEIAYPFIVSNPYCLSLGDTSYVTFPMNPNIFVYNNLTGKMTRVVCGNSELLELADPYSYSQIENRELELSFVKTKGWYGTLQYHSDLKMFSRTLALNAYHSASDDIKKETEVIFFDKNLVRIGSHVFVKNGPYAGVGGEGFSVGFATPDGFIGSFKKEHYTSDDQFRYAVKFKIVMNTE